MRKLLLLFTMLLISMGIKAEIITVEPEEGTALETIPENIKFTFSESVTIAHAYILIKRGMPPTDVVADMASTTGTEITVPVPAGLKGQINEMGGFNVSLEGEDGNNLAMASFQIAKAMNTLVLQTAEPAANSKVESLSVITLTYGIRGTGLGNQGFPISGIDASKENVQLLGENGVVATSGLISVVDDCDIQVTLDTPITANGVYTLTIPEATVYDGSADINDWDKLYVDVESNFTKEATYNPEVTLTYTVDSPVGIGTIQTIPTGEVSVYSVQGVLLRKGDAAVVLNNLAEGIYIVNNQKIVVNKY